jgi:hypothetical protein
MSSGKMSPCYDCKHHGEPICTHDERCPFGFAEWKANQEAIKEAERKRIQDYFIAYEADRTRRIKKYQNKRK